MIFKAIKTETVAITKDVKATNIQILFFLLYYLILA